MSPSLHWTRPTIIAGTSEVPPASPAAIGRYIVLGELGSGGQAEVVRIVDPDLGRSFVLKLSRKKSAEEYGGRAGLVAEGRILADLDHPGLVRVFDVGIHDGRPYLVLEHVPGPNLEQTFSKQRPSVREGVGLISSVGRVAAYAHRRGVVHSDICSKTS